jgi:hypothetical protein
MTVPMTGSGERSDLANVLEVELSDVRELVHCVALLGVGVHDSPARGGQLKSSVLSG